MNERGDNAANFEHEITRLRGQQAEQQARHQARAALNAQVRHWLLSLGPSVVIEAAKPLKPKLKAGETLVSAVEKLRKQIGALRAEHQHTKTAAPTIAEMKAAAAEHVSKLAERGKPRLIIEPAKFELGSAPRPSIRNPTPLAFLRGPIRSQCSSKSKSRSTPCPSPRWRSVLKRNRTSWR